MAPTVVKHSGFVGDLSAEQEAALQQIKTDMKSELEHPRYDDTFILRFLRARKFDVAKTKLMLSNYVKWRAEFKVDEVIKESFAEVATIKKYYPHAYHGTAKDGRPFYIERIGAVDITHLLAELPFERMLKYWVKDYETLLEVRFPACSVAADKSVTQSFTVLDLEGLGVRHLGATTRHIIKDLMAVCQDYFPESLGNMVIVNAPTIFSMFWTFVKGLLDEKTVSKIKICGGPRAYKPILAEFVNADQLPDWLGGTVKHDPPETWMTWEQGPWHNETILTEVKVRRPHCPDALLPPSVVEAAKNKRSGEASGASDTVPPAATTSPEGQHDLSAEDNSEKQAV